MRIAKPLLLVTTPLGLLEGFYECYKLAGGLLFLMLAMVGVVGTGFATVASLGKALFSMSAGPDHGKRVVEALSWRIGLSVALFVSIFASYHFGWIAPHAVR